jgi:hypothetical protein
MGIIYPLRFSEADAIRAHKEWGANCGPGALAAVLGKTLDEVHPHLPGFDQKGYTNPAMMRAALISLRARYKVFVRTGGWPLYGLARVQWEGPWTAPGVPARVAYRHTHWVGVNARNPENIGIFDINAMNSGGWIAFAHWMVDLVPWLLAEIEPKSDGRWHFTHAVEITP